jgi:hypothetical protein
MMLFQIAVIFGLFRTFWAIITEALRELRRCTRYTIEANLVRNIASSQAVSPPTDDTYRDVTVESPIAGGAGG